MEQLMAKDPVSTLFADFTHLRQKGHSRDDAWEQIKQQASKLNEADLSRLLSQLRRWEAEEARHIAKRHADPHSTQTRQPVPTLNDESRRGVIRRIAPPPGRSAGSENAILCPQCHKPNAPHDAHCYSCGSLLRTKDNVPPEHIGDTHRITPVDTRSSAHFTDRSLLYLQVRGAMDTIRVKPRKDEMVIGRSSPDSVMLPDIDLAQYDAEVMGVSRLHAGLRRHGDTLVITDMGSLNHTYLNGQRLHPHEVRVLHDGDEIRFGQLPVRVHFRDE